MTFDFSGYSMPDGTLRAYSDVGCYPIFYVSRDRECYCAECADEERHTITAADANWEDPDLYCESCGERIESAYAEDDRETVASE